MHHPFSPLHNLPPAPARPVTIATGASRCAGLARWRELAKLLLRGCWHWHATRAWLMTLNATPALRALAWRQPQLVAKIHRPYLSNAWSPRQRLAALQSHYAFIARLGLDGLMLDAAAGGVELASFMGASSTRYQLVLRAVTPMEREGELALQLLAAEALVYSLAFTFFHDGRQMAVGVGCMQGPKGEMALARIRTATRDLHGLRPKNLMLKLLCVIGCDVGCLALRLVGNDNRAVNRARLQGKVHADYNAFWRERGAMPRDDGDFALHCTPPLPPDLDALKSSKRSLACKRHRMLDLLGSSVLTALRSRQAAGQAANHRSSRAAADGTGWSKAAPAPAGSAPAPASPCITAGRA